MKKYKKKYVWIVLATKTNVIYDCFSSKKKADNFISKNIPGHLYKFKFKVL